MLILVCAGMFGTALFAVVKSALNARRVSLGIAVLSIPFLLTEGMASTICGGSSSLAWTTLAWTGAAAMTVATGVAVDVISGERPMPLSGKGSVRTLFIVVTLVVLLAGMYASLSTLAPSAACF